MRYFILVKCNGCGSFVALEEVPEKVYTVYNADTLQYPYGLTHMSEPELHSYFVSGDTPIDTSTIHVKGVMPYTCDRCWGDTSNIIARTGHHENTTTESTHR